MSNILIYGANGYTGQLIVDTAHKQQLQFTIAGRNATAIEQLANHYQCPSLAFDLSNHEVLTNHLKAFDMVIHCAGPFSATAEPMMQACLASQTHYLDITGEIQVFERAQQLNQRAKDAGIVLCPGVGFDVIPTDCIASQLKEKLPDATHLKLGFDSGSGLSPGTAKTSIEGLGQGGKIRKNKQIVQVPLAYRCETIDFGNGEKNAMTIPWGDVSTAYHSTGIPNIEVFIPISPRRAKSLRRLNWVRWVLGLSPVQNYLKKKIAKSSKGPNEEQRAKLETYVWGEVRNAAGKTVTARIKTANGYELTHLGAVEVAKFLTDYQGNGGAFTPSKLIDSHLVERLEGSSEVSFEYS
ncbi:saccharopine dehydrogenase family protein [Pleionea litopenaei]|uniref:Saccharopine dehydrogenase NADP-binding domain-containing protein n=1 Tax=Pleionea litopenaei TaxID=3070815 RepID=A0AA51X8P3_9GAMM|nr:saccharopine dehydrogenase NADP-binding domain-containing protein [Pleionea sp. HL-JVS1]WMS88300.1 saccharopine dehydrogenase NADP-binding domain-containing protein [Pleionea sp. HL-JVS1]